MKLDLDKLKNNKSINELLQFSIINIDKPLGPTSFSVSHFIKKSLNLSKSSHFGTLDPTVVSGVLPIALNRACRLAEYFMHRDKTYVGIMRLHEDIPKAKLESEIKTFIGKISQLPPVRSRVKRQVREREVKTLKILEVDGKDVLFETQVQAGTYIRKLIHDLGEKIGGAHMLELRRTKAGIFDESNIINLYDFEKAVNAYKQGNEQPLRQILIPAEILSQVIPIVQVKKESVKQLLTGKPLMQKDLAEDLPKNTEHLLVFYQNQFISVSKVHNQGDIVAKPEFVFN
jgi:H/ACA ribonucleoprotein complex subunit 4